ncbi:hypothetical protein BDB00DRAFT_876696 [Zychaea mexicana]|uniref:uncharacterized protein n=1 Tax=Zychaea mexicana TaxID=64656 RepID=UPI0022FE564E|nr:uncharacterized protein BDB00DRAFT_876696 [Zychaea mexicana]KAI9489146.1 hypothetical protein BDB00DRAFT_876696 [Zychaea mexicana]
MSKSMDAASFLQEAFQFVVNTVDDWKSEIPETLAFQREIGHVQEIIGPVATDDKNDLHNCLSTFINNGCKNGNSKSTHEAILKDILRAVYNGKKRLAKYYSEKSSSVALLPLPIFKRKVNVTGCRKDIEAQANSILSGLDQLFQLTHIASKANRPTTASFEKDLTKECYLFWKRSMGQDIIGSWDTFISAYTKLYANFQPLDLDYTQTLLCAKDGKTMTLYGFIAVTRKHAFPFESMASHASVNSTATSEEARAEIAKMVIPLVTEFSSQEMQAHLVALYGWYKGTPRDDAKALQNRADEWALLVKASRQQTDTKTDMHTAADGVDAARRAINFFYQRFMMMWRIGPISRDMFASAGFPGKPRINDFLRYVQPLDRANLTVIIGKQDVDWNSKKPEVYGFLETLL